jgi:hypothetical protein
MSLKKVPGWYSNPDAVAICSEAKRGLPQVRTSVPGTMMVGFHCFLRRAGFRAAMPQNSGGGLSRISCGRV